MDQWDGFVRPPANLKRWLHPIVFGAWAFALLNLLFTRRYTAFLRPEFDLLLALALVIAVRFTLSAITTDRTTETDFSDILRALVLLVPLLYLMIMPDAMLGSNAFKNRFIGPTNITMDRQDQSWLSSLGPEEAPGSQSPPDEGGSGMQASPHERTILELFLKPKLYHGHRVIFTGMIQCDEQLKQYYGDRDTAVYHFMINCCAADALPLAIAVDSDQAGAFANDQWVQVDGIFYLRQINGKPVPFVEKSVIKPIESPNVPYLINLPRGITPEPPPQ
jgi:uncharacterized repeat protein (TIGR03943 family)